MSEAMDFKVIGTRPVRPDGVDKVTGRASFGADFYDVIGLQNCFHIMLNDEQ